ncbi:MAG: large subunit ribosomal protein [Acidobacteriota bacterium]|jgi:large subunit ribosomal protein L22|nr:large subunit ribosomal protein [Acidobacteriota bacterium]
MEAIASAKYLRGSAQKARLVVDMIRGKRVGEALAILQFTNKRAASGIEKCLRSAIANATETAERQNVAVDPDDLFVKTCFVDIGPTKNRRRVRPAPQGRAYREQRHFCHVTVTVSTGDTEEGAVKVKGKQGSKTPATAKAADAKPAARQKSGAAKKTASAGDTAAAAEKKTTKRASKKAEAAPAEETAQE